MSEKTFIDENGLNSLIQSIKSNVDNKYINQSKVIFGTINRYEDFTNVHAFFCYNNFICSIFYDTDGGDLYFGAINISDLYIYTSDGGIDTSMSDIQNMKSNIHNLLDPNNSNNNLNLSDHELLIKIYDLIIPNFNYCLRYSTMHNDPTYLRSSQGRYYLYLGYQHMPISSYCYNVLYNEIKNKYSNNSNLIHGLNAYISFNSPKYFNNNAFNLYGNAYDNNRPEFIIDCPSVSITRDNGYLTLDENESNNCVNLGSSKHKWNAIYAVNGTIQTSDRTQKNSITPLDDEETKRFIMGLIPSHYKMNQGSSGRTHYGLIAQDIEDLMNSLNMESTDFAGFIKSPKYNEIWEDENGNQLKTPQKKIIEGEYDYSLRYDEFISPMIKMIQMQQKTIESLEKRIEILEANRNISKSE